MSKRQKDRDRLAACCREHEVLAARLARIGFVWSGTVQWRMMTCGRDYCPCRTDPKARHGPYPYWTSKKAQKTVSKLLTPQEAALYEEWIANRRELDETLKQMKNLSRKAEKPALRLRTREESDEPRDD